MWHALETRIPPPLVMLACGLLAWGIARSLPVAPFPVPGVHLIAYAVMATGLLLNLLPKLQFRRAGTTVNPLAPSRTHHLVTDGLYRFTRNPMYLGQACILSGWILWLNSAAALPLVPIFMLYITRFQIRPEERALLARFPGEFAVMRQRVRRWL